MNQDKINDFYYRILNEQIEENKNKKIALWGASLVLEEILNKYNINKYNNILGIIDKNSNRWGKDFAGYKIYSPEEIKNLDLDTIFLTIKNNSTERYNEIINYLSDENLNISVKELFNKNLWLTYHESLIFDKKFPIRNSLAYIPDYPKDYIQRIIVETGDFYEITDLKYLDKFLNQSSIVLDIGANIGNHTVYWGNITNVKKIYSFEPIKSTYEKLKTNIKINNLENKVKIYNNGVGRCHSKANIDNYDTTNCGASTITICQDGEIDIISIDSLNIKEKISLIKIDTEGFELDVLYGAIETIKKHKPIIYVEVDAINLQEIESFFEKINYKKEKQVKDTNYLYIPIQ